ncbi:MAG: carboxypeptidase-like regulatory domain-containing protein, partial [Lutimonas sp.]
MSQHVKLFISFFILSLTTLFAQDKMTLSGTVTNALNNETLIGVTIIIPELGTGTTTNEYGFYSISIPEGEYTIEISYVGFEPMTETILLNENIRKNFSLTESSQQL